MSAAPYPWQEQRWQELLQADTSARLPHAILACGPSGTGLEDFVHGWVGQHFCTGNNEQAIACGACPACEQIRAGTFPDLAYLRPEETGKAIGVDAVRGLIDRLGLTAGSRGKIAVIEPADSMTLAAANSLLKTLEEPPAGTVIVLVSRRPSRLPATVRSRCRMVSLGLPEREQALAWLRTIGTADPERALDRAGGAPLIAAEPGDDPERQTAWTIGLLDTLERGRVSTGLLEDMVKEPLATTVPFMASVITDLVRVRVAGVESSALRYPEHEQRMQRLADRLDVRALFHYLDQLNRAAPGPSSSLRTDMQVHGLLADAASLGPVD